MDSNGLRHINQLVNRVPTVLQLVQVVFEDLWCHTGYILTHEALTSWRYPICSFSVSIAIVHASPMILILQNMMSLPALTRLCLSMITLSYVESSQIPSAIRSSLPSSTNPNTFAAEVIWYTAAIVLSMPHDDDFAAADTGTGSADWGCVTQAPESARALGRPAEEMMVTSSRELSFATWQRLRDVLRSDCSLAVGNLAWCYVLRSDRSLAVCQLAWR